MYFFLNYPASEENFSFGALAVTELINILLNRFSPSFDYPSHIAAPDWPSCIFVITL